MPLRNSLCYDIEVPSGQVVKILKGTYAKVCGVSFQLQHSFPIQLKNSLKITMSENEFRLEDHKIVGYIEESDDS